MEPLNSAAWLGMARDALAPPDEPLDPARWGPRGRWQDGTMLLNRVLAGWFVGEVAPFAPLLAEAGRQLSAPDVEGTPYGADPVRWLALHRTAQALCAWMQARPDDGRWQRAAAAWRAVDLDSEAPVFADQARLVAAMADGTSLPPAELAAFARRALAGGPRMDVAIALALAFHRPGAVRDPALAVAAVYALLPELALPPALLERGWRDADAAELALPRAQFRAVDQILVTLGLTRDPDAAPQPPLPELASWTRQPTLATEADWQAGTGGPARLSLRGTAAGRIAALLSEALGGTVARDEEAALAELLTVSPRASARSGAERWQILRTLVAASLVDPPIARALVAAGLADPDWRVRMTALYGVGRFRFADLARAAQAAEVPAADNQGLNMDDRRTLLALREAAVAAATAAPPPAATRPGGGPGGAARIAFVAQLRRLFDQPPAHPADRSEALVQALLGGMSDQQPQAWQRWR